MKKELMIVFDHCIAFDDFVDSMSADADGFVRYVKRCQVTTSFLFAYYPNDTLVEVLDGLKLIKNFMPFVIENQASDPAALRSNFKQWVDAMDREPPWTPGANL